MTAAETYRLLTRLAAVEAERDEYARLLAEALLEVEALKRRSVAA